MKFATWNVNGLRACLDKGLFDYIAESEPALDIIALQETKLNKPFADIEGLGYEIYWNFAQRPGYSGTAVLCIQRPAKAANGISSKKLDTEGRVITLTYPGFCFVNVYTPNSQGGMERLYYRLMWDTAFARYIEMLSNTKDIIICGDFNVARDYIDVYPENLRNIENPPGFITEERDGLNTLLDLGFTDVFRQLHPAKERSYTWWSNRFNKRRGNEGRRIDYFLVSDSLMPKVKDCIIRDDIYGSDHAPVELVIDI